MRCTSLILLLAIGFACDAQINLKTIDSITQKAAIRNNFEGTILIADKGDVIFHNSFGSVDVAGLEPVQNESKFAIASITKLFTAIVILQLVEEGKLHLNDNLQELLPEIDIPKAKKVTVHHLLLHISGLPNEPNEIYWESKDPSQFAAETLKNQPGRFGQFNYANIDFVLLGFIIEKLEGVSWQDALGKRILDPTGMQHTGFLIKDDYPQHYAYSFSYDSTDKREADPLFFIENFYAAGCMFSTAEDLLKLDQALYTDALLSPAGKGLMFTSYPEYNYSGYSVWTYNYPFAESKPKVMERRGGILGANSVLIRLLDTKRTVIILSNNNRFNPDSFGDVQGLKEALMIEVSNVDP